MGSLTLDELMVNDALYTDDPVERHLIKTVQKLQQQNRRFKDHITKTSAWAQLKDIDVWKPFDFYHYFCTKYADRYGKEYRQSGNQVLIYKRIDEFRKRNSISKKDYKKFIDKSFDQYFNNVQLPRIAHLINAKLYNTLMGSNKDLSSTEYKKLDQELLAEGEKFDKYVAEFNQY